MLAMRRQPSAVAAAGAAGPRLPRAQAPAAATASHALRTTMHPVANEGNDQKEGERKRTRVGCGRVEGGGRALGVRPRRGGGAAVGGWRGGGGAGAIALHSKHRLLESLGEKKRAATPHGSRRQWSRRGRRNEQQREREPSRADRRSGLDERQGQVAGRDETHETVSLTCFGAEGKRCARFLRIMCSISASNFSGV